MSVLMIDVGGTNVKVMASYEGELRRMPSGEKLTASEMVRGVTELASDLEFDRISLGFPGLVESGQPVREPHNLGDGWVGFDLSKAFGKPVRCINDAAMQALGNYVSGRLLFLGFGTSIGATVIVDDIVVPIEVGRIKLTLKPDDLRGFYANPPEVQELLTAALELTQRNLGYLYGSADPERGGMDCSGTIYFLLQKLGVNDVPRSASQQYVWVRRADVFHSVVSTRLDSFELDALRPGNLLFWTGTYSVDTDPPVTHTMIYLGKARSDGRPLMVGASDGRMFRGSQKFGVSVFDFTIPKPNGRNPMSRFIGYGEIPR